MLDAITQPRTKKEIAEETGLTAPQITEAIQTLREKMQPIHTMGTRANTHLIATQSDIENIFNKLGW